MTNWKTSSFCNFGSCVQVLALSDGHVLVQHSQDPTGPRLAFSAKEWDAFVQGVRAGEFDLDEAVLKEAS